MGMLCTRRSIVRRWTYCVLLSVGTEKRVLADKSWHILQGRVGITFWQESLFLPTLPSNGVAARANLLCFGVVNLSWCYLGGMSVASVCNH